MTRETILRKSEHTEAHKAKGENLMKKTMKEIRAEELKAREEAAQKQQEEEARQAHIAELEALPEKNSVDAIPEVREGLVRADRDTNGKLKGINGGKFITKNVNGRLITAETEEELKAIEERMEKGIVGDGFLTREVTILGQRVFLKGRTEEELEEDLRSAEKDLYSHKGHHLSDVDIADAANASGYTEEDLEEVTVKGHKFLISYSEFRAIDLEFNKYATAVEVTDMPSIVKSNNREEIKKLIIERLEVFVDSKR